MRKISIRPSQVALAALFLAAACSTTGTTTTDVAYASTVPVYDPVCPFMWDSTYYYAPYYGFYQVTGGGPSTGISSDGGAADAAEAGAADGGPVGHLPRPLGALLRYWGAGQTISCSPAITFTDADQDGIPANFDSPLHCSASGPNGTATMTGTVAVTDADDASKTSGFSVMFTGFTVDVAQNSGATQRFVLNGPMTMAAMSGTFNVSRQLTVDFDIANSGSPRLVGTFVTQGSATYSPDPSVAASDPFAKGAVTLSGQGTLTREGQEAGTTTFTRQTAAPLTWDRNCITQRADSAGFSGGTLLYQGSGGGSVQVDFHADCSKTVTTKSL